MKFATELRLIETLSYYDRPLLEIFIDPTNGQLFIAAWMDEDQQSVQWFMVSITEQNLTKFLAVELEQAMTLKDVMEVSNAIYLCKDNTFDYGSVLEGEKIAVTDIPENNMPKDGSYVNTETYLAWDARAKERK